jgi:hypothetical protein
MLTLSIIGIGAPMDDFSIPSQHLGVRAGRTIIF